jgi:hypothetical protein
MVMGRFKRECLHRSLPVTFLLWFKFMLIYFWRVFHTRNSERLMHSDNNYRSKLLLLNTLTTLQCTDYYE